MLSYVVNSFQTIIIIILLTLPIIILNYIINYNIILTNKNLFKRQLYVYLSLGFYRPCITCIIINNKNNYKVQYISLKVYK